MERRTDGAGRHRGLHGLTGAVLRVCKAGQSAAEGASEPHPSEKVSAVVAAAV
jgi:hypothetical protein